MVALIDMQIAEGKLDAAAARAAAAVSAQPDAALPHLMLGEVRMAQKRFDDAEASFKRAIELEPKLPAARLDLARLYSVKGDSRQSVQTLEDGVKALPTEPSIALALASEYERAGAAEKAIAQYERILQVSPGNDLAANNLAVLLSETRSDPTSLERALALAKRFESSPNPALADTLGWVYFKLGRYEDAVPSLQRAVDSAPKAAVLQYHLGMALYKSGKVDLAKTHLRRAVEAKVEFPGLAEARRIAEAG